MSFRDDDEFDPQTYAIDGGLPGMLWRALQQQNQQQGTNAGPTPDAVSENNPDGRPRGIMQPGKTQPEAISVSKPNGGTEFNPDIYTGAQGATLDWLRSSQMQQNQYHPAPTNGIDFDVLTPLITGHESGNRPNIQNPRSSATGPGQFIDSTWIDVLKQHRPDIVAQYPDPEHNPESKEKLLALRSNPALAGDMTTANAQDNAKMLRDAGLPVTSGNVYLSHFAGPDKAKKVLRADPSTPAESIFDAKAMNANPFLKGMNAGQVRTWADQRIEIQARKMKADRAADFQRAFSTPQPGPLYLDQSGPDFGIAQPQALQQPVRRLVGRPG